MGWVASGFTFLGEVFPLPLRIKLGFMLYYKITVYYRLLWGGADLMVIIPSTMTIILL